MVDPSFLAVTSTPSIGPSSLEATVPVSADCAEVGPADTRQMSAVVASSEIVVLRISFSLEVQRILVGMVRCQEWLRVPLFGVTIRQGVTRRQGFAAASSFPQDRTQRPVERRERRPAAT